MTLRLALASLALASLVLLALAPAAAFARAGDLDQRFGTGGTLLAPLGAGDSTGAGIALAPDGDLLVAGDATAPQSDGGAGARRLALARLDGFGGPRWSFAFPPQDPAADTAAAGVAVRPDGRILTAGSWLVASEGRQSGLVTLHAPGGDLDPGFGGRGWVTPGFDGGGASAVAAATDGGAFVAGASTGDGTSRGELLRLTADGSGDPGFGTSGLAERTAGAGRYERYDAVAALPGGGAVVAGTADPTGTGDQAFLVARFTAGGAVERVTLVPLPGGASVATSVLALPDGSVVAAGAAGGGADADWALVKLRPDGAPDPSFGDAGRAVVAASAFEDRLLGLAAGPRGTIVAGGYAGAGGGTRTDFAVARFTVDGRLDPSFGDGGVVRPPVPGETASANGVVTLPDGGVVAAGTGEREGRGVVALARLLGDGPVPPLAVEDPPGPPSAVAPVRGRFSVRLVSRRVERGATVRVRVRWPSGWRGAAKIRLTRARPPRILLGSRRIRGTGGRGRTYRVKLTRLGRDALLGVRRTEVRVQLLPDPRG